MSKFATIACVAYGDEDGFQSQRFGVQIQVTAKKIYQKNRGGARSRDRVRGSIGLGIGIGGSIGLGIGIGLGVVVSMLLFFRNTPPPPKKKWKIT